MPELNPKFISVKEAAKYLGDVSTWQVYRLLDDQAIASQYLGKRRLVLVESLMSYAEALPATAPEPESVA